MSMNLRDVVPSLVEQQQRRWETGRTYSALLKSGKSEKEIARRYRTSVYRVADMACEYEMTQFLSPLADYLSDDSDVRDLAKLIVDREARINAAKQRGVPYVPLSRDSGFLFESETEKIRYFKVPKTTLKALRAERNWSNYEYASAGEIS